VKNARRTVVIANDLGIHLRAAGALVRIAGRFQAEVWIERNSMVINGKSIMSVLTLAAGKGTEVTIHTEGDDAEDALVAVCALIERGFENS
jgi:phosphocarrier protein HPr